jgi:hypothetical protein
MLLPKTRSNQLALEGWTKRCSNYGQRLTELITMYQELGFDVCLMPIEVTDLPHVTCQKCFLVQYSQYKTVYTRPKRIEGVQRFYDES